MKLKKINKNPFFSVITVVKNDEKNIEKTIKSILSQTLNDYEYIIIDGKSQDKTFLKIQKYKKKIKKVITQNDNGIYFAMNKGAKFATGEIIVFVNSGDILKVNALKHIKSIFNQNNRVDFVFGTVLRHYTKNTILKYGYNRNRLKFNFDFATSHSTGFFLKRKVFKKLGYFDTSYKCSADYDIYYKVLLTLNLEGASTKKNQLIGIVKSGGFSSKINFIEHLFEETLIRIKNKQNIIFIIIIFFNALFKYVVKKII